MHLCRSCGTVIAYPPRTNPAKCPMCEMDMIPVLRMQTVDGVARNGNERNPIGVVYIVEGA